MNLNLLKDPLIRLETSGERSAVPLSDLFAILMNDGVDAFPALRPHQRHAWHAFLSQLGAIALYRSGRKVPPTESIEWACLLRGLTPDHPDDAPWRLVVDDLSLPAFMQPAVVTDERGRKYKSTAAAPDELDILVTSKNHDLKSAVGIRAKADDWLFALITLQTMGGYEGAGNYGISRMNGGLGNRPALSLAPSDRGSGGHVRRDILALLERRRDLVEGYGMTGGGPALLWTLPWDGTADEALDFHELDPFYIEVCRSIRLRQGEDGRLWAMRATSKSARIDSRGVRGRTGDPWTPFSVKRRGLPLTLGPGGFTHRRVPELLFSEDWELPALSRPTIAEQRSPRSMSLVARATVRGQGTTHGYHERSPVVGSAIAGKLMSEGRSSELVEIGRSRLEQVRKVRGILSHAIQLFAAHGEQDAISQEDARLAHPWLDRFGDSVDASFLEDLEIELEADEGERQTVRNSWLMNGEDGVVDRARQTLSRAEDTLPSPVVHSFRARAEAESLFERRLRWNTGLPFLFEQSDEETE